MASSRSAVRLLLLLQGNVCVGVRNPMLGIVSPLQIFPFTLSPMPSSTVRGWPARHRIAPVSKRRICSPAKYRTEKRRDPAVRGGGDWRLRTHVRACALVSSAAGNINVPTAWPARSQRRNWSSTSGFVASAFCRLDDGWERRACVGVLVVTVKLARFADNKFVVY